MTKWLMPHQPIPILDIVWSESNTHSHQIFQSTTCLERILMGPEETVDCKQVSEGLLYESFSPLDHVRVKVDSW